MLRIYKFRASANVFMVIVNKWCPRTQPQPENYDEINKWIKIKSFYFYLQNMSKRFPNCSVYDGRHLFNIFYSINFFQIFKQVFLPRLFILYQDLPYFVFLLQLLLRLFVLFCVASSLRNELFVRIYVLVKFRKKHTKCKLTREDAIHEKADIIPTNA